MSNLIQDAFDRLNGDMRIEMYTDVNVPIIYDTGYPLIDPRRALAALMSLKNMLINDSYESNTQLLEQLNIIDKFMHYPVDTKEFVEMYKEYKDSVTQEDSE